MAYFVDTNFIVRKLYDILNKKNNVDIVKTNKPSNPETFAKVLKNICLTGRPHGRVVSIRE